MTRKMICLFSGLVVVLALGGIATAQVMGPDNQLPQGKIIHSKIPDLGSLVPSKAGGDDDIYYQATVGGAGSYDLDTGWYQACLWDTFDIAQTYVVEQVQWYGYLYDAQDIEYWIAPASGGEPGTPVSIGTTYETVTGTPAWHTHVLAPQIVVDPGQYYYLIMKVSVPATGYWWCSDTEVTDPHASMTSTDLVNWVVDVQYSGNEYLAGIWVEGTPGEPNPLTVDTYEVSAYIGGYVNFFLNAGPDYAKRDYILAGGVSGNAPGTLLPGGLVLPVNLDWFTYLLWALGDPYVINFFGTLDADGYGEAQLCFPGHCQLYDDIMMTFAFTLFNPFDFVSNYVEVLLLGAPEIPDEYFYDDGSTENLLTNFGGEIGWANYFDVLSGADNLVDAGTLWGSTLYSGYGPGNGVNANLWIWEDTNGDQQLWDGDALIHSQTVVNYTLTGGPINISTSGFFVGFGLDLVSGQYVFPMDESQNPTNGNTWLISMQNGSIDPVILSNNTEVITMQANGYDCYCPARATY
jgi:hypothetical protein